MLRSEVIQSFLNAFSRPRYLEIGVNQGVTFHEVRAASKVGVDPEFQFDIDAAQAANPDCVYEPVTSDAYFGNRLGRDVRFDVIYLDGLHTFEQTLRDLLNSISHLEEGGVIIVDDVSPTTYTASLPDLGDVARLRAVLPHEATDQSWMGDVYKLVFFVQTYLQQFQYGTVADNHGQMVLWRDPRPTVDHAERRMEFITRLDFNVFLHNQIDMRRMPAAELARMHRETLERSKAPLEVPAPAVLPLHIVSPEAQLASLAQAASLTEFCTSTSGWYELLPEPQLEARSGDTHGGERPPPAWWSDGRVTTRPFQLFKLTESHVFPAFGVVVGTDGIIAPLPAAQAAYFSADFSTLPHCVPGPVGTVFDRPASIPALRKIAIVMPWGAAGAGNYGHFLLDAMPAAVSLDASGVLEDAELTVPRLLPWQSRHFELAGLSPVVREEDVYLAEQVVFTNGMNYHLHNPNVNYLALRDRQFATLGLVRSDKHSGYRLYMSRKNNFNRVNRSEAALETALRALGFEIVDMSDLTVDQQISMAARADVIAGCTGAAFANVIYAKKSALVVEIQPSGMDSYWVQNACAIVGCRLAAYFLGAEQDQQIRPEHQLVYNLDVSRFVAFLEQSGVR